MNMQEEIRKILQEKNAVLLVHNYQIPAVQDIADFLGDSLGLARKAQETEADTILFAGVDFMAETAKVLNPDKRVLLSAQDAVCPMASQLLPEKLISAKRQYPDADVVLYVNSSAECKAIADCCCTSANALKVANAMESNTVLLGPDRNLALYVNKRSEKRVIPVPAEGFCYVHRFIDFGQLQRARQEHPNAFVIVHPECNPDVQEAADAIGSTSQMLKIAGESDAREFLIGTEREMVYRLQKEFPEKKFFPVAETAVCGAMKKTSLQDVYNAIKREQFEVTLDREIIEKAKKPIEKMLQIT